MKSVHKISKTKTRKICSVPLCSAYVSKDISFFKFPKEEKLRTTWQKVLRIRKPVSEYMLVCSQHFLSCDLQPATEKTERRRLKKGVIPSRTISVRPTEKNTNQRNRSSSKSSSSIYNLKNERTKNCFEFDENSDLKEESVANFIESLNNFRDGKQSPTIDSKCEDWASYPKLSFSENIIGEEIIEINEKKPRPERRKKRCTKKTKISIKRKNNPVCPRSVEISKLVRSTKALECFKSVCHSTFLENEKETDNVGEIISHIYKSNVLPPLNCASSSSKKQQNGPYQTHSIKTEPVSNLELADKSSFQACMGEIIEFVRMQILDYNLKAFGNSFKIKECALQFQEEGEMVNEKYRDANTLIVHPTKLLSSNQCLLKSVTMSLDLHRLQQENKETISTGFSRTMLGKTETIEKNSDILSETEQLRKLTKDVEKTNESMLAEIVVDDDNPIPDAANDHAIFPVLSHVTIAAELLKDSISTQNPTKQNADFKKLARFSVPSPQSVPSATRTSARISLARRKRGDSNVVPTSRKISRIANNKWMPIEKDTAIQNILGTTKIPRVVLPNLPDDLFKHGGRVPVETLSTAFADTKTQITASPNKNKPKPQTFNLLPQLLCLPGLSTSGSSPTKVNLLTKNVNNTSLSLKTADNIPSKPPQAARVAGYLLVPKTSTVGGTKSIMYVPKPNGGNTHPKSDGRPENFNFQELLKKGLPVQTFVLPGNTTMKQSDGSSSTGPKPLSGCSLRLMESSTLQGSSHAPQVGDLGTTKVNKDVIQKLLRENGVLKKLNSSSRRKKTLDDEDWKDKAELVTNQKILSTPSRQLAVPLCQEVANQKNEEGQNDEKILLSCRGKTSAFPAYLTTQRKKNVGGDKLFECTVCGEAFVEVAQLGIHQITHAKCEVRNEDNSNKFATGKALKVHIPNRKSCKARIAKFRCKNCKKRFTTRNKLKCHVKNKHPPINQGFRTRCEFCNDIFELEYYRQVHLRDCREKKTVKEKERGELNENFSREHFKKQSINQKEKNTETNRRIIEAKTREKVIEDDKVMENNNKIENCEIPKETPKKPTAIRSTIIRKDDDLGHQLSVELSRIFDEDFTGESSPSEYEQEELLNEDLEDVITVNHIQRELIQSGEKTRKKRNRFKNIYDSDTDEDSEVPDEEILKIDGGEIEENSNEMLNNVLNEETVISECNTNKIDINRLLSVDGGKNNIIFQEMEDDEYFSMDESTQ